MLLCVLRFDEVVHLHGVYELDGGVGWAMMLCIEDRWKSCVPTLICGEDLKIIFHFQIQILNLMDALIVNPRAGFIYFYFELRATINA